MNDKLFQELDYLHDCVLLEIRYDTTDPEERKVSLLIKAPDDLGYPAWDGQSLCITASGVYLFRYVAWGHVLGQEILDSWNVGISDATQKELSRGESIGLIIPPMKFTVTFHSGSYFELICEDTAIDVRVKA